MSILPNFRNNTISVVGQPLSLTSNSGFSLSKTDSQTSGQTAFLSITPTYSQTGGTTSNTDFLINRTGTAGSGNQLLIDARVNGVSQFNVDSNGNVNSTSSFNSPAFSSSNYIITPRYLTSSGGRLATASGATSVTTTVGIHTVFLNTTTSVNVTLPTAGLPDGARTRFVNGNSVPTAITTFTGSNIFGGLTSIPIPAYGSIELVYNLNTGTNLVAATWYLY